MRIRITLAALLTIVAVAALTSTSYAEQVEWERTQLPKGAITYFDTTHDTAFAIDALGMLTGRSPSSDSTNYELAQLVLDELNKLETYGQKETAQVRKDIPTWFLDGYSKLNPRCVSKSRYLNSVLNTELLPNRDIGSLYAFWCVYDAEWFALSRNADYKAWLSAVIIDYPAEWMELRGESDSSLHNRLVTPLQTPDEPYREIDNWINNFTSHNEAFAKPKVRDALVQELVAKAGLENDDRFFEDEAYYGPTPDLLGLSSRDFYLLAALSLEFFQEIYELDPGTRQLDYFRDYFIATYYKEAG